MDAVETATHAELLKALERLREKYPAVYRHFVLYELEDREGGVTTADENPTA